MNQLHQPKPYVVDNCEYSIGEYIGTGASFDDVKVIFRADNITIVKD